MAGKADIVVFRKQDGKLVVRPSVFVVEKTGGGNKFKIRNDAENDILVYIPHDEGIVTKTVKPSKTGSGHKEEVDVTGKTQNDGYVVFYRVLMGAEEAEGESAPALIIDD